MNLHDLLDRLLAKNGSDLHLAPGHPPLMRVRGDLVADDQAPLEAEDVQALIAGVLTPDQQRTLTATGDLDFAYAYPGKARFRGNVMRKHAGIGAVFRTIPTKILTLDQLDVPRGIRLLTEVTSGLVIVAGPVGSGRSTTLAAMLDHINGTRYGHILTIEDPIEFVHQPKSCLITQKEVGDHVPTLVEGLRGAVRENPDIVLAGELHGAEEMKLALLLASSGILVFATMHASSLVGVVERFANAFPADEQAQIRGLLADSLAGVVVQQLFERVNRATGRIAAHAILIGNPTIAPLIRDGDVTAIPIAIHSGVAEGMQTLDFALDKLVREGLVRATDALDAAVDKDSFALLPHVARELTEPG